MSTQRLLPKKRKSMGRSVVSALSLLAGVLMAWQLLLPSVALAAAPSSTSLALQPPEALELAGVSVVRLVTSYTSVAVGVNTHPTIKQCTGLGVLVGSWASGTTPTTSPDFINWVLTDSVLVTTTKTSTPCSSLSTTGGTPAPSQFSLTSVQITSNAAYGGGTADDTVFGTFTLATSACATCILSTDVRTPGPGAALFAFHTSVPQPFLTPTSSDTTAVLGIELANTASTTASWPASAQLPLPNAQMPAQFLAPFAASLSSASPTTEPGMPQVNNRGELTGLHLSHGSLLAATLNTYMNSQPDLKVSTAHSNTLKTAWDSGVTDFYAKKYAAANTALQPAMGSNPHFLALTTLEASVLAAQNTAAGNGQNNGTGASSSPSDLFGIPVLLLAIVGLVVLLALFVLVSLSFGRRRAQRRRELARFKADELEAQRRAEIEVQRQQQTQVLPDLHCPHCGYSVQPNDAYCPNCRALLSPSASGLHLHATPPSQSVQQAPDASWAGNYQAPPQMSPQQAAYTQQPSSLVPASSISDQQTIEMSPDMSKNGQIDPEKTVPNAVQQLRGRNLSLVVGSRSDPGIKRKHKPNEDSLFAVQGARTHNSRPQQFGLFVVADGMGGHANGQDASRLAIQTIIDYLLPKLSASNELDDAAFLKLLTDGVQHANEAVHKRNLEERADMGTTMTAALVVGSTAYIANVGDSRTYIYREPEGLQKVTRDHSVVASLVDAGIIQPDDIYTHPKRNQIYRSLGEKPVVEVDPFQVPLQPGDKLLLCSDGLWDMVRDPEIQRIMSAPAPDPTQTGNALIQAALNGGGEDNVSVIVVYITETSNRTGMTGIQLLAKPDSVTVPEMPSM